jgi:DNA-binding MarR family transcriptional regulator
MSVDKPSAEQVASALNSGAIHLLRSLAAIDKLAGLTPARLSALSVLVFAGPQSLGALATAERVAGPTMTRIVDGLANSGLADRLPDPADGRGVLIAATPAGDGLMRAAAARRISAISAAIESLPAADQRRIAAAAGLLDKVAATVRAGEYSGSLVPSAPAYRHRPVPRVLACG